MVRTTNRGWQPLRALTLLAGLALAGGAIVHDTQAQPPKKPGGTKPPDKKPPVTAEKPPAPRTGPAIVLPSDAPGDLVEVKKIIDTRLETGWKENKLTPSHVCADHEFIRRASIDIIGRIATPEELDQFEKDLRDPSKKAHARTLLVDRLLKNPDYPRHWANVWTNWLLSRSGTFGRGTYHEQLATWLEDQFASNKPHHEIVKELITARGKNTDNGAVNFILAHVGEMVPAQRRGEDGNFEMVPITSRVTRLFLGIQTQCTQCHDHPFDANLKQEHFWGINAFMRQVNRKGTPPMVGMRRMGGYPTLELEEVGSINSSAVVAFEKRNGVVKEIKPTFIDKATSDGKVKPNPEASRRDELYRFIHESPNFPRATVNRLWAVFFGKGFCNPVDDFNENNQVSNPDLLNELGEKYRHYNFDTKKLIRWICNSEAYNLSCVANPTNDKAEHEVLFSRQLMKALSPEVLFESLMTATRSNATRDAQRELRNKWLDNLVSNFGDDEGNETSFNGSVVQALLMMNGDDINKAITSDKSTVAWALNRSRLEAMRINDIYRAVLNRNVGQAELRRVLEKFPLRPGYKDHSEAARFEDLLWGLVNSNEFMLNH